MYLGPVGYEFNLGFLCGFLHAINYNTFSVLIMTAFVQFMCLFLSVVISLVADIRPIISFGMKL